ncbi:DUF4157 domain-containing protein [Pseudomonadota bacterium]
MAAANSRQPIRQILSSNHFPQKSANQASNTEPSVKKVTNSGGQTLSDESRRFFEPRMGADLSQIRIHTDPRAADSAQRLDAKAYTHGQHIAFAAGEYQPDTTQGKKLLAHELAHTLQQTPSDQIQRFANCHDEGSCPERESGESDYASNEPMNVESYVDDGWGLLISNFAIDSDQLKPGVSDHPAFQAFITMMDERRGELDVEVLGFSDCSGPEQRNQIVRGARAISTFDLLSQNLYATAMDQVRGARAAPISDCISNDESAQGRMQNRSALIRVISSNIDMPATVVPLEVTRATVDADVQKIEREMTAFTEYLVSMGERAPGTGLPAAAYNAWGDVFVPGVDTQSCSEQAENFLGVLKQLQEEGQFSPAWNFYQHDRWVPPHSWIKGSITNTDTGTTYVYDIDPWNGFVRPE